MGAQLEAFYEKAKEKNGFPGQIKMAMLTGMTVKEAAAAIDTPDNIKKFAAAFAKL